MNSEVQNIFGDARAVAAPGASAEALIRREAQEIQASMMVARNCPRNPMQAMDRIINAFARPTLCEDATYEYARGGTSVSGLSIRAAEVLAQNWGNLQCGVAELSRANGQSECMAFAVDLETGFRDEKRFFVRHWRDTKKGGYAVTDERDIYELVANMGARRKRACILAVIPTDVQESAERQIEVTLKKKIDLTPESRKALLDAFAKFDVTQAMIEKRIQRHFDTILPAQVLTLRRVYASLKDGMSEVSAWFEMPETTGASDEGGGEAKPAGKPRTAKPQKKSDAAKETKAADKPTDKPTAPHEPVITLDQSTVIADKLKEEGVELSLFLASFQIGSVEQLPAQRYEQALKAIDQLSKG